MSLILKAANYVIPQDHDIWQQSYIISLSNLCPGITAFSLPDVFLPECVSALLYSPSDLDNFVYYQLRNYLEFLGYLPSETPQVHVVKFCQVLAKHITN